MSDEMRRELNGVKKAVGVLGEQVNAMQAQFGAMKTDVAVLKTDVAGLKTDVAGLKTDVAGLKTDVSELKTITRNTAITVAGHTEALARIEKRLTKLDEFDGLKNMLDAIISEIITSRRERALRDKSFSDQQATLTDHELRLTRIELRSKPS